MILGHATACAPLNGHRRRPEGRAGGGTYQRWGNSVPRLVRIVSRGPRRPNAPPEAGIGRIPIERDAGDTGRGTRPLGLSINVLPPRSRAHIQMILGHATARTPLKSHRRSRESGAKWRTYQRRGLRNTNLSRDEIGYF